MGEDNSYKSETAIMSSVLDLECLDITSWAVIDGSEVKLPYSDYTSVLRFLFESIPESSRYDLEYTFLKV